MCTGHSASAIATMHEQGDSPDHTQHRKLRLDQPIRPHSFGIMDRDPTSSPGRSQRCESRLGQPTQNTRNLAGMRSTQPVRPHTASRPATRPSHPIARSVASCDSVDLPTRPHVASPVATRPPYPIVRRLAGRDSTSPPVCTQRRELYPDQCTRLHAALWAATQPTHPVIRTVTTCGSVASMTCPMSLPPLVSQSCDHRSHVLSRWVRTCLHALLGSGACRPYITALALVCLLLHLDSFSLVAPEGTSPSLV